MQASLARPVSATRGALLPLLVVAAVFGLGWGAAFGAGVVYGRMSGNAPATASRGTTGTGSAAGTSAPADPGHFGPATGPARGGPAGGGH